MNLNGLGQEALAGSHDQEQTERDGNERSHRLAASSNKCGFLDDEATGVVAVEKAQECRRILERG